MTPFYLLGGGQERDHHPPILATLVLATLDFSTIAGDTHAAAASECLAVEIAGSRQTYELPMWNRVHQWSLPPAISQQDGRKDLPISSACVPMSFLSAGLIVHADVRNQGIAPIDTAAGKGSRAHTIGNRASTTGNRTIKTRSRIPTVKISIPPHSGKKHALRMRTLPPEVDLGTGERPSVIIGPKDQHHSNTTAAMDVFPLTPVTQSGHRPVDLLIPFENVLQKPGYATESNRMNSTTTLALHGGECAYGCP